MGKAFERRYAVGIAVLIAAYWLVPRGLAQNVLQLLTELSALAVLGLAAGRNRPARTAWAFVGLGAGLIFAGDIGQLVYEITGDPVPYPSVEDAGYLLGNLALAVGLALLHIKRPRDLAGALDTAVVTVAGGLLFWFTLVRDLTDVTSAAGITTLGYPLTNMLLLALAVGLLTSPADVADPLVARWLSLAVAGHLIGDMLYGINDGAVTIQDRVTMIPYFVMYLGFAGAGLSAARTPAAQTGARSGHGMSAGRLLGMYAALMVIPGLLLTDHVRHHALDQVPLAIASTLLSLLVPARMWLAMRQLEASTQQRDAFREDLAHQAAHDALTDLPNRAYLMETLAALMHRARRSGEEVALLFVDLDYFKRVNDQLGHAAGDEVLRTTAERMKSVLRAGDVVGRQGGDEFVVLIDPVPSPAELMDIAERLVTIVSAPILTAAGKAQVGASVGIALARDGQTDPEQLLQDADLAAYRAKSNGRGRAEIFDQALRTELEARAKLEAEIRHGLATDQFELHYQPVMSVATGQLRSYEALIRWRHPERGMVPPNDFIPTAEESLLICEIGRWVLRRATRQLAEWTQADPEGHGDITMAVNISARHLASRSLVDEVRQALHDSGLEASRLVLEITETVLLDEPTADAHLRDLRTLGVTVSLDDFGTGYTSIGQLQKLQVDTLKIDQSFLRSDDPATQALVQLMVTAAHAFNLDVVAEGVETQEQLDRLVAIGCELAQGYYLGRPKAAQDTTITTAL